MGCRCCSFEGVPYVKAVAEELWLVSALSPLKLLSSCCFVEQDMPKGELEQDVDWHVHSLHSHAYIPWDMHVRLVACTSVTYRIQHIHGHKNKHPQQIKSAQSCVLYALAEC